MQVAAAVQPASSQLRRTSIFLLVLATENVAAETVQQTVELVGQVQLILAAAVVVVAMPTTYNLVARVVQELSLFASRHLLLMQLLLSTAI